MKNRITLLALSAALTTFAVQAGEEDLVKYRKSIMEVVGGHMSSAVAIVKGEVPYKENLAFHAAGLSEVAPLVLPAFKSKAMSSKSEALPEIWDKWAEFEQAAKKLEKTSADFSQAVASNDMAAVGAALGDLGKSCKSCHDDFVEEH